MTIQQMLLGSSKGGDGLYSFSYVTFTSGGQQGGTGPTITQIRNGMSGDGNEGSWKNNTNYLDTINGQIIWTVPLTGTYRFDATGAGCWTYRQGGYGAKMRCNYPCTEGEKIRILVGQVPPANGAGSQGNGAGGSFVVKSPYNSLNDIIVIAGGGGGGHNNGLQSASNGQTGTSGGSGTQGASGGTSGYGGQGSNASGGGGFLGDGGGGGGHTGGYAYVNGGYGGDYTQTGSSEQGGFGGGGVSGNSHGGGGGGYSGGGATGSNPWHGGGGGSGFGPSATSTFTYSQIAAADGSVYIEYIP